MAHGPWLPPGWGGVATSNPSAAISTGTFSFYATLLYSFSDACMVARRQAIVDRRGVATAAPAGPGYRGQPRM